MYSLTLCLICPDHRFFLPNQTIKHRHQQIVLEEKVKSIEVFFKLYFNFNFQVTAVPSLVSFKISEGSNISQVIYFPTSRTEISVLDVGETEIW